MSKSLIPALPSAVLSQQLEVLNKVPDEMDRGANRYSKFLRYHAKHPEVYAALRAAALQLKADGYEKFSMKYLVEMFRNEGVFSLGNELTAYYARFIMIQTPELSGFFTAPAVKKAA